MTAIATPWTWRVRAALDLVLPNACGLCGASAPLGAGLCQRCAHALRPRPLSPPRGVDRARCLATFDGNARSAVLGLKFHREVWRGRPLGLALGTLAATAWPATDWDAVVPVPTTRARLRERGYDQADRLARGAAHALRLPVRSPLSRAGEGRQADRTRAERATIADAIAARPCAAGRVLLVDDVLTTGETLAACAAALRANGVAHVDAVTVAWTQRERPRPRAEDARA